MTKNSKRWSWLGLALAIAVTTSACSLSSDDGSESSAPAREGATATTLDASVVSEPVMIAGGATHDADVAIDPASGTIYAAWAVDTEQEPSEVAGNPQNIMVASSQDDGATWSTPVRVNDTPGFAWAGFNSQVRIAVTGPDELFVMWPLGTADYSYYTMRDRSTDGGESWGEDRSITSADPQSQESYGALTNVGQDLYVAFLDYRATQPPHSPTGVDFIHSKDGGQRFGESNRAALRSCECCDNGIAVDSEGTLYIAFRSQNAAGEHTTIRDSAVVRSYDDGQTWSMPVLMGKDDWVFNGCPESGPELAIGQDDVVHGVYWTGKDGRAGVYYTKSTDGGASFATPMPIATADFYPPAYMDLTEGSDGSVWIVWDDRREAEKQVHLARVTDGSLEVLDGSSDGQTPALAGDDEMTVMVWSDPSGLQFAQLDASQIG